MKNKIIQLLGSLNRKIARTSWVMKMKMINGIGIGINTGKQIIM